MAHEARLTADLRVLLHTSRVGALGTLGDDGAPFVSMVPYAMVAGNGSLIIHVSALAPHTGHLQARPLVSMLVMQPELPGKPVHALPRVTLGGEATALAPDTTAWQVGRTAYLARFPEAGYLTQLGDFMFVAIEVRGARHVAGFGAARQVSAEEVRQAMGASPRDLR